MKYNITIYGNPILRTDCKDVTRNDQIEYTIKNMWETLDVSPGVGIAAPQCGFPYNIFLLKLKDDKQREVRMTIINPEILEYSDAKIDFTEGCLSIPGVFETIQRSMGVKVRFLDENWEDQEMNFVGLNAVMFQHEFDHLRGKLFIDYLKPLQKKLIQGKLKQMEKHGRK